MSNKAGTRLTPQERKTEILTIAAQHFERQGYAQASINAIAQDAGVTRALVYHYFPGKDQLLLGVLALYSEQVLELTNITQHASPDLMLQEALKNYLSYFKDSSGILRDFLAPNRSSPAIMQDFIEQNHAVQIQRIHHILNLAPSPLSNLAIASWLDFVVSTSRHWERSPELDQQDLIDMCSRTLYAALGNQNQ